MEEWQAKIERWQARLAEWNRAFEERYGRLARERKRWLRPLSESERDEIAAQARKLAGEDVAVELFGFLGSLCDAYVAEVLPQWRAKARAWVGANPDVLNANWNYATQVPDLVRKPSDEALLVRGLAAVSLDDSRADFNAVLATLARLWLAARKAGIDPAPHVAKIAGLSNPGMGGGGAFMAQTLREFESSAYFRTHVRPQLARQAS
jgi:hypothetical protein